MLPVSAKPVFSGDGTYARAVRRARWNEAAGFMSFSRQANAPKDISWSVASAHKIKLEGPPPMEIDTDPDPQRPGVFTGVCRYGDRPLPFAFEVLDIRPGEALSLRLLADECDPIYRVGGEYIATVAVSGDDRLSVITERCELTHTRFATRPIMPFTVLRSLYSLKRTAEVRAGRGGSVQIDQIKNAILTGVLTFGSFYVIFDLWVATMLLVVVFPSRAWARGRHAIRRYSSQGNLFYSLFRWRGGRGEFR